MMIKKALRTVLTSEKNIRIFKKNILALGIEDENELKRVVYQIVGDIIKAELPLKEILINLKAKKVGWNHSCFSKIEEKIQEHDDYLVKPFEVVEGVVECPKCNSKRTFSVQKQIRGCDEPMTTFSRCANCNHSWAYSG